MKLDKTERFVLRVLKMRSRILHRLGRSLVVTRSKAVASNFLCGWTVKIPTNISKISVTKQKKKFLTLPFYQAGHQTLLKVDFSNITRRYGFTPPPHHHSGHISKNFQSCQSISKDARVLGEQKLIYTTSKESVCLLRRVKNGSADVQKNIPPYFTMIFRIKIDLLNGKF